MTTDSKIPIIPYAVMSEKYTLSCMFHNPALFIPRAASDGIDAEAFYLPQNRAMFNHIKEEFSKAGELDLALFVQQRNLDGSLDRMGGPATISEIYGYACDGGGQWSAHAGILREQKAIRLTVFAAVKLSEIQDSDDSIAELQSTLDAVKAAVRGPRRSSTGKQAVGEFTNKIISDNAAGEIPGLSTGIHVLNEICGGMKPGELWVIGGRPSDGKSVILLQIASEYIEKSHPVAIFTLEMMKHEIIGRLISNMGRVDLGGITQPKKLTKHDLIQIQSTAGIIANAPLWIDASAGQSLDTITAEATRISDANGGLALLVVDYLQLIRGGRNRNETREEEVARFSGGLKQLAKALKCTVLTASQLNEQGQVRESRAIAQDADAVLIIASDGIKVLKMRNGERNATLNLHLDGRFQRFTERHA